MNYKKVFSNIERPKATKEYNTNIGLIKFDLTTNAFYSLNNENCDFAVRYWFKEIESFEESTEVVMKYLSENHHPHTMIQIESNSSQLFEGVKSHLTDKYLKD